MSSGWEHDLVALFHQMAVEQVQDLELHLIGHVIEYDPATHMVRCILPTRRAVDDNGDDQPMETGWCQLGSGQVGDGHGDQYALHGGATAENPEQGEQVQVSIQHRASGLCAVANLTYNDTMQPPGGGENGQAGDDDHDNATDDTDGTLQLRARERIIKQQSGTFLKLYANGDIGIFAARDLVIRVHNDCKVTVVEGDLDVTVQQGDANVTAETGDINATALGDITASSTGGDITATTEVGDISIEATTGVVTVNGNTDVEIVSAATVNVTAPIVNVTSPVINAGEGPAFQALANATHIIETYNTHTHPGDGPPEPQGVVGIDTTINLGAS